MIFGKARERSLLLWGCLLGFSNSASAIDFKYSSDQIQKFWLQVYPADKEKPKYVTLMSEIKAGGAILQASGGKTALRLVSKADGTNQTTSFFPVRNFSSSATETLYGELHKIEGLTSKLTLYVGDVFDCGTDCKNRPTNPFSPKLQQMQNALDIERFTANVALMLSAESMAQKCQYYSRARALAASLKANHVLQSSATFEGWADWGDYAESVGGFIDDQKSGFASIRSDLCEMQTRLGRGDDEKIVREKIDSTLKDEIEKSIEAKKNLIAEKNNSLSDIVAKSQIDIRNGQLYALERGLQDTDSLLAMIKDDSFMLYKEKAGTDKVDSLVTRLKEKQERLQETDNKLSKPQTELKAYKTVLIGFLSKLEQIHASPSLSEEQRKNTGICAKITSILDEGHSAAQSNQDVKDFRACLIASAKVYKEFKNSIPNDAVQAEFARNTVMLLNIFAGIKTPIATTTEAKK